MKDELYKTAGKCQWGLLGSWVLCWVPCDIFLKQYIRDVRKYYDWLHNYTACFHTVLTYSEGDEVFRPIDQRTSYSHSSL